MSSFTDAGKFTLAMALLLLFAFSLWMMAGPAAVSPSTYAAGVALLVAVGAVTLMTWRSARPTGSMGQLLHAVETEQTSKGSRIE